jgi:hypothetical protein
MEFGDPVFEGLGWNQKWWRAMHTAKLILGRHRACQAGHLDRKTTVVRSKFGVARAIGGGNNRL